MNDESSQARKAAAAAISGASPKRPIGMCTRRRAARSGSLAKSSCEQRRVDRPRAQRVDPHPLASELHAELARHGEHAALGGGVADLARRRPHDGDERRGVDDRPPAAGEQVRERVLAAQVDRREVDPLHALPGVEAGVEDGVVVGRADAGVVAADVDPPEAAGHLAVQRLHLGGGRDVGPHEHAADGSRHLAPGPLVEVDDRHLGPLRGEALAHGAADAAGTTGDDGDPVDQAAGVGGGLAHVTPRGPGGTAGGSRQSSRHSELMKTFLTSQNASRASGPSSRPIPDCLTPPKGVQ